MKPEASHPNVLRESIIYRCLFSHIGCLYLRFNSGRVLLPIPWDEYFGVELAVGPGTPTIEACSGCIWNTHGTVLFYSY